jgi:hypothetical protein
MKLFKTKHRQIEIEPIVAWYDIWIGFYWDSYHEKLYFFPIPMCGFVIKFGYRLDNNLRVSGNFNELLRPGLRKNFIDSYKEHDEI